mgnify:CR=1 FL=1
MLLLLAENLKEYVSGFNVFTYLTLRAILGALTALSLSLLGLGALLATSALWFTAIKTVGGLYLIYLGLRLLRSGVTRSRCGLALLLKGRHA